MAKNSQQDLREAIHLVQFVSTTNNDEIQVLAEFLRSESRYARARFIERCASLISAVAEIDTIPK